MDNIAYLIPQFGVKLNANIGGMELSVIKHEAFNGVTVIVETPSLIYNISYYPDFATKPDYLSVWSKNRETLSEYEGELLEENSRFTFFVEECENLVKTVLRWNGLGKSSEEE